MITITIDVQPFSTNCQSKLLGLLFPQALSTPHQHFVSLDIEGGSATQALSELSSGQNAIFLGDTTASPRLTYTLREDGSPNAPSDYANFDNRYTRASVDLHSTVQKLMDENPESTVQRIVTHTASLFDYGHPTQRFNDGHNEVPVIACGTAKGSCVDINTYLITALRVAEIPTVYFAGYFFPQERGGITNDMHCWVATWTNNRGWQEWDIAHHMKMGLGADEVRPGYNPKPGRRFALSYGRGLTFDIHGMELFLSHLSEPTWVFADGTTQTACIEVRLEG